jgi:hypothetical protein
LPADQGQNPTMTMDTDCNQEIIELHRFFEDWFTGKLGPTDAAFSRFPSVLADAFEIISPSGEVSDRDTIVERVRGAHGAFADPSLGYRIWIDGYRGRSLGGGLYLANYEEWQESGGVARGRLSTVIFRRNSSAPNGIQWVHVHEVWLPQEESNS